MKRRADDGGEALEVKALYSVAELARAAGVTEQMLLRALRLNGVELVTAGRSIFVPLSEIETRIPPLWRSIVRAERVRADAGRGAGT